MSDTTVQWVRNLALEMDTNSVRDFTLDFTAWLDSETIGNIALTPVNCSAIAGTQTATTVKIRVSAVEANASVQVRLTTNSGQVEDFTIRFSLVAR